MSALPFMPLYVADYLADTTHLSTEAHGAYLLLLMVLWKSGGELQNDDKILARIVRMTPAKWERIKDEVLEFFQIVENKIFHNRITQEIQKAKNLGEVRSEVGKRGVEAKRLKSLEPPQAIASDLLKQTPQQNASKPLPSYTSHSIEVRKEEPKKVLPKEKRGCRLPDDFEPDATCLALADELNLTSRQRQTEFDKFKDYWKSKAGAAGIKLDWQATFRNWLRNSKTQGAQNGTYQTNHKPNSISGGFEIVDQAVDAAIERETQRENSIGAEYSEVDIGAIPRLQQSSA